jgi:osmotically-inducible protein OsmY
MRIVPLAYVFVFAFGLAACDSPEPPKPAAAEPVKPMVQSAAPAPTPPSAPEPSADERLLERVKNALRDTRKVDAQGVGVTVKDGVVSLFGTAPSDAERRGIEKFVAGIDGVKSVVSKLVVVRGS